MVKLLGKFFCWFDYYGVGERWGRYLGGLWRHWSGRTEAAALSLRGQTESHSVSSMLRKHAKEPV